MPDVALISKLSRHSLESQRKEYRNYPIFFIPDDLPELFRPTKRRDIIRMHLLSLAILADNENSLRKFLSLAKKRGSHLIAKNENQEFVINGKRVDVEHIVEEWRVARRAGAAKAGGEARAEKAERDFWAGFSKIVDRWHLPSKGNTSRELLEEADTTRNTVVAYLGYTRLEWRKLSEAKRARILKGKINV